MKSDVAPSAQEAVHRAGMLHRRQRVPYLTRFDDVSSPTATNRRRDNPGTLIPVVTDKTSITVQGNDE